MPEKNKSVSEKLRKLINRHFYDIAAVIIVILTITAAMGLFRLISLTPQKEPIRIIEEAD